jgi:membrane protease subunit (stomatin/prohibitin family)
MSLWKKITGELVDIIEWLDNTNDTMVYRFERYQNEIKYGAKLVVREGQSAAFINEGKLADVYGPGTYTLTTQNMPILATLKGWKYGFESPFKAEVYFASTRLFTGLKWGTKNPIMMRDPEFGPVRIRAFGSYIIRVKKVDVVIKELSGTDGRFTTGEISDQLRDYIVSRFADITGQSKIAVLDMAANYEQFANFVTEKLKPDFERYGLELDKLLIENVSLPAEVEQVLDKRTSMGIIGDKLGAYTQYQTATAIPDAAKNPGGLAAAGAGLGLGMGMAGQVSQALTQGMQPQQAPAPATAPAPAGAVPPPLPTAAQWYLGVNGQQLGPFDEAGLRAQASSGALNTQTLVWKAGMPGWVSASQTPDVAKILVSVPPPLPPK